MTDKRTTDRRDFLKIAGAGVAGLVIGGVVGSQAFPVTMPGTTETATVTQTVGSTQIVTQTPATTAKTFEGVPLNFEFGGGSWMEEPVRAFADTWGAKTGAKVSFIDVDYMHIYEKLMLEAASPTGAYDIAMLPPYMATDMIEAQYLIPFDKYIDEGGAEWKDMLPLAQDYVRWGDHRYGYPMDGDIMALYYNKEKLDQKSITAPRTWDEFLDAGEKLQDPAKKFSGIGYVVTGSTSLPWWWGCVFHSLGGLWFDPNTMEPLINTDAGIRATDICKQMCDPKRGPPGAVTQDFTSVRDGFTAGDLGMIVQMPDMGPAVADPKTSKVIGKVGFGLIPGSKEIWDHKENKWRAPPEGNPNVIDGVYHRPMAPHNWMFSITRTCKNPDAAADLILGFGSAKNMKVVESLPYGFDPHQRSIFNDPGLQAKLGKDFFDNLLANMEVGCRDFRVLGQMEYYDVFTRYAMRAYAGELSSKAAMDAAAKDWNAITDRFGGDKQRTLYVGSMAPVPYPP